MNQPPAPYPYPPPKPPRNDRTLIIVLVVVFGVVPVVLTITGYAFSWFMLEHTWNRVIQTSEEKRAADEHRRDEEERVLNDKIAALNKDVEEKTRAREALQAQLNNEKDAAKKAELLQKVIEAKGAEDAAKSKAAAMGAAHAAPTPCTCDRKDPLCDC